MIKVAVIGAGAWGTALAHVLSKKGHDVTIWAREPEVSEAINNLHENTVFLKGEKIDENLTSSSDISKVIKGAHLIVNVVPTQFIRSTYNSIDFDVFEENAIFLNASKGVEQNSLSLISEIFFEIYPKIHDNFAILSGPSFAEEVVKGFPTSVTVASKSEKLASTIAEWFHLPNFRVYTSSDIIGVQLGGAVKNVMAIAAGAIDGMGLGLNTRAALITRGLSEIARLGVAMGAKADTFIGLSGMGDLVLTCTGNLSRNRAVGFRLGSGDSISDIISSTKTIAEGVDTTKSVYNLSLKYDVDMPITSAVYNGIYKSGTAKQALMQILARELKKDGI